MQSAQEKIQHLKKAFLSPDGIQVFTSWVQANEIWEEDPYDVDTIHKDARSLFCNMIEEALSDKKTAGGSGGKTLLLLGESGAGKTHLMRAFRNYIHANNYGYFGYMQMTTPAENYERFIQSNFINSLDHPYQKPLQPETSLERILNGLAEHPALAKREITIKYHGKVPIIKALREYEWSQENLDDIIQETVSAFLQDNKVERIIGDPDILTALLYLLVDNPLLKKTVMKYLRGESLSSIQQKYLGGLHPRTSSQDAQTLFRELVHTIWGTQDKVVVVCLDQWETMQNYPDWENHVKRAADAMAFMHDGLEHCIFVISCLEDHFQHYRERLSRPTLIRLENNPSKLILKENIETSEDALSIVARRLDVLYGYHEVESLEDDPTYPFKKEDINRFNGSAIRRLILACNKFRAESRRLGYIPSTFFEEDPFPEEDNGDLQILQDAWNAFNSTFQVDDVPDEEADIADLLARILPKAAMEFQKHTQMTAQSSGWYVEIQDWLEPIRLGVCNHKPGAKLNNFLLDFYETSGEQRLVIVRTVPYAKSPAAKSTKMINQQCKNGHRKAKIEDADLRAMLAFLEFEKQKSQKSEFSLWRKRFRPLTQLECLKRILNIDDTFYEPIEDRNPETPPKPEPDESATKNSESALEKPNAAETGFKSVQPSITIGCSEGLHSEAVSLSCDDFVTHAAFLGSSGSGKTVAAMSIIEQLLLNGIPAILIDRKGDLCSYALRSAWDRDLDEGRSSLRDQLKSCIDVQVYTPGEKEGRSLFLSLIPPETDLSMDSRREEAAKQAAAAICDMMGYRTSGNDAKKRAILFKAIEILAFDQASHTLEMQPVIDFIHDEDAQLMGAIGHIDRKLIPKISSDLQALLINQENLLSKTGTALNIDELLGLDSYQKPSKTRLSIISTKFLRTTHEVLFWVAQFLSYMEQWISKRSQKNLQAVLMFDEADLYLPANRQPATKAPLENLLRRARSAGLGLFLATQNPGDMDYKCREQIETWFLGRLSGGTSLNKLKPMTETCQGNILEKLPGQQVGQFHVIRPKFQGGFKRIKTQKSLVTIEQLQEKQILDLIRD